MSTLKFQAISKRSRSLPVPLFFTGELLVFSGSRLRKPRLFIKKHLHHPFPQRKKTRHRNQHNPNTNPKTWRPACPSSRHLRNPKAMMCWFSKAFNKAKTANIPIRVKSDFLNLFFGNSKWRMIWMFPPPPRKFLTLDNRQKQVIFERKKTFYTNHYCIFLYPFVKFPGCSWTEVSKTGLQKQQPSFA